MIFQRLLDRQISFEMEPFTFVYLDIVIMIPTFVEHMICFVERVLNKILSGLTINPDKCDFC